MTVTWTLGDHFSTMGIPLIEGRFFTTGDRIGSQPVAVINEEGSYWGRARTLSANNSGTRCPI